MAGGTGVTVRVVSNRLPQLPAEVRAALVGEVQRATFAVEAKSKALAPVRTGTLRRSIHSVFENGGLTGLVGPSVLYGKFVEFGTRRMGARPYMRPAAEAVLAGFAGRVGAVVRTVSTGGSVPPAPSAPDGSVAVTPSAPSKPARKPKKYVVVTPKHPPMGYRPKVRASKPRAGESSGFREAQRRYNAYQRSSNRRQHRRGKST